MSAPGALGSWLVVASGVQGGHAKASGQETLQVALLILAMALGCALIFMFLRRRYWRPRRVADQWQALATMGELCPEGWRAQITVYGWDAPLPDDAPPSRIPPVELEWTQFDAHPGRVAVTRRAWASSIDDALQTMVDDRRTDAALEQIERAANDGRGASWGG
jgi:hypothetical protein